MQTHLQQELEHIKGSIFGMADIAVESLARAIESLRECNPAEAKLVIERDDELDNLEKDIDEACIRILVTRQPAAVDMRFVLAMLKINTDLERIGDLAANIAKEVVGFSGAPLIKPLIDIPRMSSLVIDMIRQSLRAITEMNAEMAREVITRDDEIDALNMQIFRELLSIMAESPAKISQALGLIMVARSLERMGDHATNIAERVVYYIEGVDIRHSM